MAYLIILLLSIVQGVAEFLPISSSGHLVLLYDFFGITENNLLLTVILHFATLLAIVYIYRKDVWQLVTHPFCKTNWLIVFASIPTVIVVFLFKDIIENSFAGSFLFIGFLFTAIILALSDFLSKDKSLTDNQDYDITNLSISKRNAVFIGIAQGVACVPGISRSGSTIATGLMLKENKHQVTKFSFLISIPVIIGSLLFELLDYSASSTLPFNFIQLSIGFVVAFIVGVFSIKLVSHIVNKNKLAYFSYYLIALSTLLIIRQIFFL